MTPRIDVHSHYFGPEVLEALRKHGETCKTPVATRPDGRLIVHTPERPYGPIAPAFYDLDLHLEYMRALDIERQMLVAPPFLFLYWTREAAAYRLMEMENDSMAAAVQRHPDRFVGFGTVMLQDVPASVRECERVKRMGLRGIEIGSNIEGRGIEEEEFWPVFEAAEALDLAVLIHPANVAGQERMPDYHLRNLIGFPVDTTIAAAKIIFSGLLDRFPRLRICLGQAGGFLPFIIGRLDAGFHARPECRANIDQPPSTYLRRFYYDSIIHSPAALGFLIRTVGADRVMLGTDFPFDMSASSPVEEIDMQADLSEAERADILGGTAARFLAPAA